MFNVRMIQYAALSALAGAGIYAATQVAEDHGFIELDPKPMAFDADPNAYRIFSKLHRFRKRKGAIDDALDAEYRTMLQETDNLLYLYKQLRTGKARPDVEDPWMASGYAEEVDDSIDRFLNLVGDSSRHRQEAGQLCDDLHSLLEAHQKNILTLCEDAVIEDSSQDDFSSEEEAEAAPARQHKTRSSEAHSRNPRGRTKQERRRKRS